MKGIVVASHGLLAKGMEDTLKLFFNNLKQIEFISLKSEDNIDYFFMVMKKAAERVDTGDGAIIMTDMFGGSPNNCAMRLMQKYDVIAGYNLPLLMEIIVKRHSDFDIEELVRNNRDTIIYINEMKIDQIEDEEF